MTAEWIKSVLERRNRAVQTMATVELTAEQRLTTELNSKWSQQITDTKRALSWWNHLQLNKILDDAKTSGLLKYSHRNIEDIVASSYNYFFESGSDIYIRSGQKLYQRDGVNKRRMGINSGFPQQFFLENSLSKELEKNFSEPESHRFLSLQREYSDEFYVAGEDDHSFGHGVHTTLLGFRITPFELFLLQRESAIKLGPLPNFKDRTDVEAKVRECFEIIT